MWEMETEDWETNGGAETTELEWLSRIVRTPEGGSFGKQSLHNRAAKKRLCLCSSDMAGQCISAPPERQMPQAKSNSPRELDA